MPLLIFVIHFTYLKFLNTNLGPLLRDFVARGEKITPALAAACYKYVGIKIRSRIAVLKFNLGIQVHLMDQEMFLKTLLCAESFIFSFKKYIFLKFIFPDIVTFYVFSCLLWVNMNKYTQGSDILSFVSLRHM